MEYRLNGELVKLDLSGPVEIGSNHCLLDYDDNLVSGCSWDRAGFTVDEFLSEQELTLLTEGVRRLVMDALIDAGLAIDEAAFRLEQYHTLCREQRDHLSVINFLKRRASLRNLPIPPSCLDRKVSQLCGKTVSSDVVSVPASGFFFIRIVRPSPFVDNNPPHKDVWLDRLRHAVNLYLPIAGSSENSSLPLVEGSHYWSESRITRTSSGATVNGVSFSVPSVVSVEGGVTMVRPDVGPRQGMVFSPYLIHGGAINLEPDLTRVSLEVRFWRKP